MAKIARPVQEISEFSEQSLYYCTLIEKINKFLFVVIFSKIKDAVKKTTTIYKYYSLQISNINHSRKLKQFPYNRAYCMVAILPPSKNT